MDGTRFDSLARSLTTPGSRRRALAVAFTGALGLLGLEAPIETSAGKSGKCLPECSECQTCQKGNCKKKNGKTRCDRGKCKAKTTGTPCGGGSCQSGSCVAAAALPPGPTCTDGAKNGNETVIDCARCANRQGCATRDDCAGALCSAGTCQECSSNPDNCGTDTDGTACACTFAAQINASVCLRIKKPSPAASCLQCPPDTVCFPGAGEFQCQKRCGAS
jgi:hypothetical protein